MPLDELFAHCFVSPSILRETQKDGRTLSVRVASIVDAATAAFRLDSSQGRRIVHDGNKSAPLSDGLFFTVQRTDPKREPRLAFLLVELKEGEAFERAVTQLRATYDKLSPSMKEALSEDAVGRTRWGAAVRWRLAAPVNAKKTMKSFDSIGVRFVVLDHDDATSTVKRLLRTS